MKKRIWIFVSLIFLMILFQFIPVNRSNPETSGEISAPGEIRTILRRSCYDCHSHNTHWPWYSRAAPVSWFIVHDVNEGREHLNFSGWDKYSPREKIKLLEEIRDVSEDKEMPPQTYLWLHPTSRLSPEQMVILKVWTANSTDDALPD